jgi:hypothetical protein
MVIAPTLASMFNTKNNSENNAAKTEKVQSIDVSASKIKTANTVRL